MARPKSGAAVAETQRSEDEELGKPAVGARSTGTSRLGAGDSDGASTASWPLAAKHSYKTGSRQSAATSSSFVGGGGGGKGTKGRRTGGVVSLAGSQRSGGGLSLSLGGGSQKMAGGGEDDFNLTRNGGIMVINGEIGPHVNVYELFHADSLRHDLMNRAAIKIQRTYRAWLAQKKTNLLKSKIEERNYYCDAADEVTWMKFVKGFVGQMGRIQQRYGLTNARPDFHIEAATDYFDKNKKFAAVFRSMAKDGRLSRAKLLEFFSKNDMFPSQKEIDATAKLVFKGCAGRGELVFALDAVPNYEQYRIQQTFVKELVSLLDCVREGATRVGYVSVSDTESRSFPFGVFHTAPDIAAAIDEMRHTDGCKSYIDGSVGKMKEMLLKSREGVARIGVVLSSDVTPTERLSHAHVLSQTAITQDNVYMFSVGAELKVTERSLRAMTSRDDWVFTTSDDRSVRRLRKEIANLVCQGDCPYCRYRRTNGRGKSGQPRPGDPDGVEEDGDGLGGLYLEELLEVVWTLRPPDGVGVDPVRRSTWLRPIVNGNEVDANGRGGGLRGVQLTPELIKCLRLVFEARLTREGVLHLPVGTGKDVHNVTDVNVALKLAADYMDALNAT